MRTRVRLVYVSGRNVLTKSIVTTVEAELRIESTVEVMAAIIAASMSPRIPIGKRSKTSVGKTIRSGFWMFGYSTMAKVPGKINKNRNDSFTKPAKREPHRP